MATKIEWVRNPDGSPGKSWNPVTGCSPVSLGCQHCYARRRAKLLAHNPTVEHRERYEEFDVCQWPERLEDPYHWKKPQTVLVCSMSDIFHERVPFEFAAKVHEVINNSPQHLFLILTKRIARAVEFYEQLGWYTEDSPHRPARAVLGEGGKYPLPNLGVGTTVEHQDYAYRILYLARIQAAAFTYISAEPLLGPLNLIEERVSYCEVCGMVYDDPGDCEPCPKCGEDFLVRGGRRFIDYIDYVFCGGETGPKARITHPDWARDLCYQCAAAKVYFLFKSWGEWAPTDASATKRRERFILNDGTFITRDQYAAGVEADKNPCRMVRVGRKHSGRVLDGNVWDEWPAIGRRGRV